MFGSSDSFVIEIIAMDVSRYMRLYTYFISFFMIPGIMACERDDSFEGDTANQVSDISLAMATDREEITERVNMPEMTINELKMMLCDIPGLSSFILYQDGDVLADHYNGTNGRNRPVNIKSASKSFLSALVGIAIKEEFIESINDPIVRYLPEYFESIDNPEKKSITIRHLLTMSSGLRSTSFRNYGAWVTSSDWLGYSLRGKLENTPGSRMRYSTGDTHLLSAVLTRATGMDTRQFAERHLFDPLGIRIGGWDRDPLGYYFGGNNMSVSPGGLLEFGKLYLQNGMYGERQLLPAEWIDETMTGYFTNVSHNYRDHDYGYLWWRNTFSGYDVWFAWGYGGQYLFVIPELDAVVVFTGNPGRRAAGRNNRVYHAMERGVIPVLFHEQKSNL